MHVDTSCDCTNIKIDRMTLEPGGIAKLAVIWDTTNKRHKSQSDINVVYDVGGVRSVARISLLGDVVPSFEREPGKLVFESDSIAMKTMRFLPSRGGGDLKILGITCPYKCLKITLGENATQFYAEFDPQHWSPDMAFMDVEVNLNSPGEPVVIVPVEVTHHRK